MRLVPSMHVVSILPILLSFGTLFTTIVLHCIGKVAATWRQVEVTLRFKVAGTPIFAFFTI